MSSGLVRRKTYEEIANIITNNPPRIRYPNRDATGLFNSFPVQQFLGDASNSVEFLEQQKNKMFKQELINNQVEKLSNTPKITTSRATQASETTTRKTQTHDAPKVPDLYEQISDFLKDIEMVDAEQKQQKEMKSERIKSDVKMRLSEGDPRVILSSSSSSTLPMSIDTESKRKPDDGQDEENKKYKQKLLETLITAGGKGKRIH